MNHGHLFLWRERILYMGQSFDPQLHRHHAVQLCMGIEAPFRLTLAGHIHRDVWAALIGPDMPHAIDSGTATMAFAYLEKESRDYRRMIEGVPNDQAVVLNDAIPTTTTTLFTTAATACDEDRARGLFVNLLELFGYRVAYEHPLDKRIAAVLQALHASSDGQCSSEELQAIACLSGSRLQHLFKAQVGIPIRRYSLWLRVRRVMEQVVDGTPLTDAVLTAGFADAPHFSRIFKAMFGIPPSTLVTKKSAIRIHLCERSFAAGALPPI